MTTIWVAFAINLKERGIGTVAVRLTEQEVREEAAEKLQRQGIGELPILVLALDPEKGGPSFFAKQAEGKISLWLAENDVLGAHNSTAVKLAKVSFLAYIDQAMEKLKEVKP